MEAIFQELAKSGPWAAVAGLLIYQLVRDKEADRKQNREFMNGIVSTQKEIVAELHAMSEAMRSIFDDGHRPARRN